MLPGRWGGGEGLTAHGTHHAGWVATHPMSPWSCHRADTPIPLPPLRNPRLLWFRMGIGFTDPGTALQNGAERYEKFARFIDSNHQMPQILTLADPTVVLLRRRKGSPRAPSCDRSCVWLIENVVGAHVRAQGHEVRPTGAPGGGKAHWGTQRG